ncbi:MAG: hypothetical protein J0H01_33025 [Rhizobiales bacterium]|nr:hypothetical protein [Hyphomicrobiales bacterium]
MRILVLAAAVTAVMAVSPAGAQQLENYESWAVLQPSFPSTGGNGIMIGEYRPVIVGRTCSTRFTATEPNGTVYRNVVEFDAVDAQGGTLCTNGRWRSEDGSASGTTPFRVFFKDGVVRGSP